MGITLLTKEIKPKNIFYQNEVQYVTVPGKRDHLGNFFKIELLLQQERVAFELQNALHI